MTGVDQRSVGELLLEADHISRSILVDVGGMDAAIMLRTWGEVVQAAGELWHALPSTTPPTPGTGQRIPDIADLTMQRLQAMTDAHHRRHRTGWPGAGPADERHLEIAACFARAEDLITRHRTPQPPLNAVERSDLGAARTRIMHALYVGSHGVNVAVGRHRRQLEAKLASSGYVPAGESLRQVRAAHEHLAAFEQLAGSIVSRTYPDGLTGEHRDPPAAGRLAQAVADWDIVSHRVLVDSTHTADLMFAARTQALILTGSNALLRAAAVAGHADPAHQRDRLDPALATSQARWETIAGMCAELTPLSDRRTDPELAGASREVRAALREVLVDGAATSTAAVIAQRTDLSRVPSLVGQVLAANLDLAHLIDDVAKGPQLTGAARAVNAMAIAIRRQGSRSGLTIDDSPRNATVSPKDLLANRAVPLPPVVRTEVVDASGALIDASGAAMNAGAQLGSRATQLQHYGEPRAGLGRPHEKRAPASPTSDWPGPRCER